jgi:hypothetical protein
MEVGLRYAKKLARKPVSQGIGLTLALLLTFPVFGAERPDAPVPRPHVKVGDRWIYNKIDLWTNRVTSTYDDRVTFVGPDLILTIVRVKGSDREDDAHWTSEWNSMSLPSGWVYKSPRLLLKFPMQVGDTFETSYETIAMRGRWAHVAAQATVKVAGWEEVVVPAGKFRSLKVEVRGTYQRFDVRSSGWFRHIIWYVPEVKRWVKWVWEDGYPSPYNREGDELVEFSVQ